MNNKRRPSRPSNVKTKAAIPSARVRRSAELWLDLFCEAVFAFVSEGASAANATDRARELADRALTTIEERWPEVRL